MPLDDGGSVSGCWANGDVTLPTTSSPPQGSQRYAGVAACRIPRALCHDTSATDSINVRHMPSVQATMGGPTQEIESERCCLALDCRNQHGDLLIPRDSSIRVRCHPLHLLSE